jgi:hypothetical protein
VTSAVCLVGDLAPLGRAELIENGSESCRVWVDPVACGGLDRVLEIVEEWLRTCSLPATEVRAGGQVYTVEAAA